MNTFSPSQPELDRRMAAFTALLTSLYFSLLLSSCLLFPTFIVNRPWFSLLSALIVVGVFIGFRFIIAGFFQTYVKTKIVVTGTHLERHTPKSHDRFLLQDIRRLSVKRTARHNVREIGIRFVDGKWIFLDGVADFDQLRAALESVNKNLEVAMTRERLDYDHPLFYPLLGISVGVATTVALKFMVNLHPNQIKIVHLLFTLYLLTLGGYFIFTRPLAKRYGGKFQPADYLCGFLLILASVVVRL